MPAASDDSIRLKKALRLLEVQHVEAQKFVMNTLGVAGSNAEYPRLVVEAMQVMATNQLTLAQAKPNQA